MMQIGILGGGALGLLWGGRLTLAGLAPVLITRTPEQAELLQNEGLLLWTLDGRRHDVPVRAEWGGATGSTFDLLFVTVKQFDLDQALPTVQKRTHSSSQILFWQNGWGHEEKIARLDGREWTYAAVTTEGAWKRGKREVIHTGRGEVRIGRFPAFGRDVHPFLADFLAYIQEWEKKWETSVLYDDDILQRMWEKLAVNCAINPLTALHGIRNGELMDGAYRETVNRVLAEVAETARRVGIGLDPGELLRKTEEVCRKTARNKSSMLQDLERGARTEIAFLNGAVVRLAEEHGLDVPVNRSLFLRVRAREKEMI
jgi:2-dehydropantoate 2-reductase